ncbi:MAG: pilus assembly protein PilM [Phycisphaerae bacterium]|nr:pilus assembly protein PilM [Phycisphaerae bacterium]
MTLKIAKGRTLPIGIDLGTSSIKMAQLRHGGGETELLAAVSGEMPDNGRQKFSRRLSAAGRFIRETLKQRSFHGRQAVIAIPARQTVVQHIKIPKGPTGEIDQTVRQELSGKLPFPAGSAVIRHILAGEVLGDEEPRQEVIAVAAARSTLDAYLDMSRRAKLDVAAINIEPFAIVECFARLFHRASDTERTTLFVDLGASSTQVVLAHGTQVAFARNLSRGSDDLDQAIAQDRNTSVDEARALRAQLRDGGPGDDQADRVYAACETPLDALAAEMTQCLRYYESVFRNRSIERAIFVGGQAYDKTLCQSLAKRLNLPAQIGDPLVHIKRTAADATAGDHHGPQPQWAVAVGLSLGAAHAA